MNQTSFHRPTSSFAGLSLLAFAATVFTATVFTATEAQAQPAYSIEFQGPTIGQMSTNVPPAPIGAGDVLIPGGATPRIRITAALAGIVPSALTGEPEVDALSFGDDPRIAVFPNPRFLFSVDEFAVGIAGAPMAPNVTSEGDAGNQQASADIYRSALLPPLPIGPGAVFGNSGWADGDGIVPFAAPGLSLIEPNPSTADPLPDPGDNLDALACDSFEGRLYLSLDASWADPLEGPTVHSDTAGANGFLPGDILVSNLAGGLGLFASSADLGLDDDDDIDALLLWENGTGQFEPSITPFDWNNFATDMVLFSVTRESPLVGMPDAFTGTLIEEGDILTVTNGGMTVPGILIFAENLGLQTVRTNGGNSYGYGDNLDALALPPCQGNLGDNG